MSSICGNEVDTNSTAVRCALDLSSFENTLQGSPLFGDSTGINDDMAQDRWCSGKKETPNVHIPSRIHRGSC